MCIFIGFSSVSQLAGSLARPVMATLASAGPESGSGSGCGLAFWGAGGVCRLGACATLKTFARFDNSESFSGCSAVVALMRFASALNGSPAARQCRVGQVDVALLLPLSSPSPWTVQIVEQPVASLDDDDATSVS